jgi:signal transduction histidine kinase
MMDAKITALEGEITKLTEELSLCYEELALFHDLMDHLRPFDDVQRIAVTVLKAVAQTLRARHAFLLIVEGKEPPELVGKFLWVSLTSRDHLVHGVGGPGWPAHDGISRAALESGRPLIVNDVRSDPRFRPYPIRITAMMSVPLKGHGQSGDGALGVINVADRLDGQGFSSIDLKLVATVAGLAGAALENALLVTDLRRVNHELQDANHRILEHQAAMLRSEKLSSLGRMAAGVAHELRNPLAVIGARAHLLMTSLRKGLPTVDRIGRDLTTIEEQVRRAVQIITGLSTYARERPPELRALALPTVIEASLELVKHQVKMDSVAVDRDFEAGLPLIRGNPNQLQQVFINLFVNAVQAMRGGGRLEVAVRGGSGRPVTVTVNDTGMGIPADNLTRVFDPFFTTKPEGEGTGLGLSIIQSIVQNHGGTVEVASEMGVGTTFKLQFPVLADGAS